MSERFDRYNLAARLEKFGDQLMTACEKGEAIENRVDVCNQIGAVCRIAMTLKALRMEVRGAETEAGSLAAQCENTSPSSQPELSGSPALEPRP